MAGTAGDSDRILASARASLDHQRAGGRRIAARSIGRRSAEIKRQHVLRKLVRASLAVGVILFGATVAGLAVGGIGLGGFVLTILVLVLAVGFLAVFPRMKVPDLGALNRGDVRATVGRTQLWLEAQRPALPPPSARQIDAIGTQLDMLGAQLAGVDPNEPAVGDVRRLIGEHLPGIVASYTRIPPSLRGERRGGLTADEQLGEGLTRIGGEIDELSRRLAEGDIDALATQARYLDYRYGNALEDMSVLPDLSSKA
ncbi:hypothetical protein Y88_2382 [Novosphingobium nitrogenifigens DSM 19370]|uniref:5-bromo-4-chloroindolyl phosphate hydrolysis protein n=1 Tax=Novosphingobium nitrogenifigens DSM 19370 TaxID=983920 RepID=F1Z6G0_9SPHN|nr:hypothetical protein [Novosphingobium nitrogenifigens]EGD59942.1 hypothetical protein Y88_2382 [Novosphingobium nitrogenifigens DSM 19370]